MQHKQNSLKLSGFAPTFNDLMDVDTQTRVLEMRGVKDNLAQSKIFKEILSNPSSGYHQAERLNYENLAKFMFLVEIMNEKNRVAIIPMLKQYNALPGYKVSDDDGLKINVNYHEALKVQVYYEEKL